MVVLLPFFYAFSLALFPTQTFALRSMANTRDTLGMTKFEFQNRHKNTAEKMAAQIETNIANARQLRENFSLYRENKSFKTVIDEAVGYLKEHRAQIKKYEQNETAAKEEKCGGWCFSGLLFDSLLLLLYLYDGKFCEITAIMIYLGFGIAVHMEDQKLTFADAMFKLAQQVTSVGYGSHGPTNAGLKIFHSLHSTIATTMVAGTTNKLVTYGFSKFLKKKVDDEKTRKWSQKNQVTKAIMATIFVIFSTVGYSFDLMTEKNLKGWAEGMLNALYMTIFTMTTVGYGDVAPRSPVGRMMSVPWMLFGVPFWALIWGDTSADADAIETAAAFEKSDGQWEGWDSCVELWNNTKILKWFIR